MQDDIQAEIGLEGPEGESAAAPGAGAEGGLEPEQSHPPLTPHKYPLGIVLFAAAALIALLYSLATLPRYIAAARLLRQAVAALEREAYAEAAAGFDEVLALTPSSEAAKFGMAKALLADEDPSNDEAGMACLDGLYLSEDRYEAIRALIPPEYRHQFVEAN